MANLVAIVGRPNVGKSTLFNRLTKTRSAIVSDTAGTTRDRQYGKCDWSGREFSVVDTGGWVVNSDDIFEDAIRRQVLVATEEADLVLFLVDVNTGVTDLDEDVAQILRRTKVPVLLVVNKADNNEQTLKYTFNVTNKGNATESCTLMPLPYQNNEQLHTPNFFMTQEPDDFSYVPTAGDLPAGQSQQVVVYRVIENKRDPIEFRDPFWPILQGQGKDYQKWTWQPK